jgi:putative transport protein
MEWLVAALRNHPELTIFLVLALGYWIGKLRIRSFTLGSVTGVLLAGVLIGQLNISISAHVQSVFFLLFLFAIGYKVGPQFFLGLKGDGLPQAALTVVLCVTGLLVTWGAALLFGYDPGTAAGLLAGGLTESATVGTATDAIGRLGLPDPERARLSGNIASAFAVSYLIGVVGVTWFLSSMGPRILGVDLAAACRELELKMGARPAPEPGVVSAHRFTELRAISVADDQAGKRVGDIEAKFASERIFIERVRRGHEFIEPDEDFAIAKGDILAVSGRRDRLIPAVSRSGAEVEDQELLDVPSVTLDAIATSNKVIGRSFAELGELRSARGVFLRRVTRAGNELPFTPATIVQRGDVLTLVGLRRHVEDAAKLAGHADRPTTATDMIVVGCGILAGGLIGIPALAFGSMEIGLGVSVGVLLGGLVCGWLRAVHRAFAQLPEAALWLFDSLGLNVFIAIVGISAGPRFVEGLHQAGFQIVIAAIAVVILPHLVTLLVGRYLVKMHPGILLGVCAGAGTSGPALAAIQEKAGSKVPTLGYGVSYAIGNVLLAFWGTVIVALLA